MHAVKTAHHIAVHHVDHRFCHRIVHALVGEHALLNDDVANHLTVFDDAHLVARFAVEHIQVRHIAHGHDAHAVGAVVGLHHDKGLFIDAVLFVLAFDLGQQGVHIAAQGLNANALSKIDIATLAEHGIDEPRVDAQQLAKAFGHFFVALKVQSFAAHAPTCMQWRQQMLFVQLFQNSGCAS